MTLSISDLGARTTDILQTELIQSAIDAVFLAGGGTVEIPAGIYRTGGLRLRSNVTLHLQSGAILEGSDNPDDYLAHLADRLEPLEPLPGESERPHYARRLDRWNNAIIRAIDAHNIAIIGEPYSYIDGRNCCYPLGEANFRGPHAIDLQSCENVRFSGYTVRNSANRAHNLNFCKDVKIENVTVLGGHDGIDLMLCERVQVSSCRLDTGDDAIAGFGSRDVTVSDCEMRPSCSAFRFGGTDELPFTFRPGNIVLRDCEFDGVERLFHMTFGTHEWCCGSPLASIRFEGCTARGLREPIYIWGVPDEPTELTLESVTLAASPDTAQSTFLEAGHFAQIYESNPTMRSGY